MVISISFISKSTANCGFLCTVVNSRACAEPDYFPSYQCVINAGLLSRVHYQAEMAFGVRRIICQVDDRYFVIWKYNVG